MDLITKLLRIKEEEDIENLYTIFDKLISFPFPLIPVILKKKTKIIRLRQNENDKHFKLISDLFCPPSNRTGIQRANIQEYPMFYGATFLKDAMAPIPRAVVLYEVSDFAKNNDSIGVERLTYSGWKLKKNIRLFAIPFYQYYNNLNTEIKELELEWNRITKSVSFTLEQIEFLHFLANEYAKTPSDYFFTSHFTYFMCYKSKMKFDGVMYPTVRLEGNGINIALKPEVALIDLEFFSAKECYCVKVGLESVIVSVSDAKIINKTEIKFIETFGDDYYFYKDLINKLGFIN